MIYKERFERQISLIGTRFLFHDTGMIVYHILQVTVTTDILHVYLYMVQGPSLQVR